MFHHSEFCCCNCLLFKLCFTREKFGNVVDEDSQPNCLQSPPLKCSHSLGKVSDWKIRSPSKCQAPAVHMKPTVVFGGLPRKRVSPKNRKISYLKKTNTCNRLVVTYEFLKIILYWLKWKKKLLWSKILSNSAKTNVVFSSD